jgi:GT2 family glycosyltransferase
VVICPTLKYRNTEIIQNQGFSHFRYREGRPIINLLGNQHSAKIQMFSGNGLLGTSQLFQSVSYDENIARIAEDLDFTLSLYERGVQLFVFSDLSVHHYEREKTKLEQAWIGSPSQAHQKARNWFLFVRKHGTLSNKLAFLCIGLP